MAADFTKYAYEEVFRYFEFRRGDGKDGLADGETLSAQAVTCVGKGTSTDYTSAMIASTSIVNQTQVKYLLKAGTLGRNYHVIVKVTTSNSQKLEGKPRLQ